MTLSVHVCKWEDKLACEAQQKKKNDEKKKPTVGTSIVANTTEFSEQQSLTGLSKPIPL